MNKKIINGLIKIGKELEKNGRAGLSGYHDYEGGYVFTNTYYMIKLNDNYGIKKADQQLDPNTIYRLLDQLESDPQYISAEIYDLTADADGLVKINDNYYNFKYLKNIINILGSKKVTAVTTKNGTLELLNNKGEKALLLQVKK